MHTDLSAARLQIPAGVANRWAMIFGGIGLLGLAATASGFFSESTRAEALSAYLVAFFYVLTLGCSKTFISNGYLSDLCIVVARTGEGQGGISLLMVERGILKNRCYPDAS